MSANAPNETLVAKDLPFVLYLNQHLAFDVLAALEDGFAHFTTVHTATTDEMVMGKSGAAHLALGNRLALFDVQLGRQRAQQEGQQQGEIIEQKLIHTPASLFARLRRILWKRQIICDLDLVSWNQMQPGDFVEFKATLRRNPVIDFLSTIEELFAMIEAGDSQTRSGTKGNQVYRNPPKGKQSQNPSRQGQNQGRLNKNDVDATLSQVQALYAVLTKGKSQDLVAEIQGVQEKVNAVLTTRQDYFSDLSMNDIIDGTFRVLGKVTRVIAANSDESINLLRKTPFGKLNAPDEIFSGLPMEGKAFKNGAGTRIEGPALQVIPMAIFA